MALVERERWGGSCPNVACRPTKAYLVAAELAYTVNELSEWMGVDCGPARVDLARVRAWKDSIRRAQDSWVEVLRDAGYELVQGEAAFVDTHAVRVGDRDLTADRVLIATGSRTAVPPIPGIEQVEWIDHVTALELEEIPESLLVVGGGPVGLEFAQIFARFGSRVTIVNNGDQIAARADTEAANELQAALEDEGIEVVLGGGVDAFARDGDATVATLPGGRELKVSHVLLASGRVPNTEALGLDRIGVETSRGYVVVDERQRTSIEEIWAAGDVATGPQFTPTAQYQARIAVDDIFGSRQPTRGLLRASDGDLHRPGARLGRAHRARGARPGSRRRRRQASRSERHARAVHAHDARPLQDRLRHRHAQGARRARRLSRGQRHRRQPRARAEARRHRRRPRGDAPRLPQLLGGAEGGGRARPRLA